MIFLVFQVLMLAMAGAVKESLSVLTLALGSSSPAFIKKPEFTQEVVSKKLQMDV